MSSTSVSLTDQCEIRRRDLVCKSGLNSFSALFLCILRLGWSYYMPWAYSRAEERSAPMLRRVTNIWFSATVASSSPVTCPIRPDADPRKRQGRCSHSAERHSGALRHAVGEFLAAARLALVEHGATAVAVCAMNAEKCGLLHDHSRQDWSAQCGQNDRVLQHEF